MGFLLFICIVLSAVYSGSETALTSLGKTGAHKLLEDDPKRNRALKLWIDRPVKSLTTILVGNNLANISASVLTTKIAEEWFAGSFYGVPIAIGLATFLLLSFGEVLPKTLAKAHFERLAVPAIRFVSLSYYLFLFLTWPYDRLMQASLRLTGQGNEDLLVTEDDIEFMVNLSAREGALGAQKRRLLNSVFEFSDTTVREVMIPRVDIVAIDENITTAELMHQLVECGHSRLPVYEENIDSIAGLFYAKDVLRHFDSGQSLEEFKLADHLRDPVFVPASKGISELLEEFQQRHIHIAVVVDEFGGTAGIVTIEDIIEEFFGEIQDEFDHEEPLMTTNEHGQSVVDARIPLDELEKLLRISFPEHESYDSLGGFISDHIGAVPNRGDSLIFAGNSFIVEECEPTHVVSVLIEPLPPQDFPEIDDGDTDSVLVGENMYTIIPTPVGPVLRQTSDATGPFRATPSNGGHLKPSADTEDSSAEGNTYGPSAASRPPKGSPPESVP